VLFACPVLSGVAVGFAIGRRKHNLDSECAAYTTQYCESSVGPRRAQKVVDKEFIAPVLSEVGVKYDWTRFNGTFLQEEIYRRPGSPEVDAAWEDLGVDCKVTQPPDTCGD
jgi:hypothetical protein